MYYCSSFSRRKCSTRGYSVTGVQTCALSFSSRRRHTRFKWDWSSDVCSSDISYAVFCLNSEKVAFELQLHLSLVCILMLRTEKCRVGKELHSKWSQHHLKKKVQVGISVEVKS